MASHGYRTFPVGQVVRGEFFPVNTQFFIASHGVYDQDGGNSHSTDQVVECVTWPSGTVRFDVGQAREAFCNIAGTTVRV